MSSNNDKTTVPISIFIITVGIITISTAAIMWFITYQNRQRLTTQYLTTAVSPTPQPPSPTAATPNTQESLTLLPETPIEATPYPDHFVSALEAAKPNTGQPVRLLIPEIELDAPISPIGLQAIQHNGETVYQWQVPSDFIAGWHHSSARIGDSGNTVLNGHHNIFGEIFRDLDKLEVGSQITLFDPIQSYSYTVTEILLLEERNQPLDVRLENAKLIERTDHEQLTLVTCWPYTDNSHRLIVIAHPNTAADS